MEKEKKKTIYLNAIHLWGEESQINVAIEEFSELITKLAKHKRVLNGSSVEEITDEIADCYVMLGSLCLMFGIDKIEERIDYKLKRLKKWIEEEVTVW